MCHLTGSLRGLTQYVEADTLTFGSEPECGVAFDPDKNPAVQPIHAELTVTDHTPVVRDRTGRQALLVNGRPSLDAALKDGDLVQLGEGGPLIRFRFPPDGAGDTKSWRTIVDDCRDIVVRTPHARYLSPLYLARHVLADIVRHASPGLKVLAATILLTPLLIIAALGIVVYHQHLSAGEAERRMSELIGQLETGRMTHAEIERRIERERQAHTELLHREQALLDKLAAAVTGQEAARKSQGELRALRQQLAALERSQTFAEEIVQRYAGAVGLLQGGYGFREQGTGRVLRYKGFDQAGNPLLDKDGNTLVTVEGSAPAIIIYYAGTAFLVDDEGTVVTNRHLIRMWEDFAPAQEAMASGFDPDVRFLRVFLPETAEPYQLQVLAESKRADLAILRTDRRPTGSPWLTLASGDERTRPGEPIILLSYPGSFDTLLGRLPRPVSDEVLSKAGGHGGKLAEELSRRGLIHPLATQGHIADVSSDVVTFEAGSATGSSGGPVLNRAGHVVAVNYAALQRIGGVQVAMPTRFTRELLAELGESAAPRPVNPGRR